MNCATTSPALKPRVTQLRRTEALKNLINGTGQGVKDFTVDGVAGSVARLGQATSFSRKDVLKICGAVFNKNKARLTNREMAELIQAKGREKAVELVKKEAATN